MQMHDVAQVADWLRDARHVAVLTGAGMSAESGVPTFRDAQSGLWAQFKPEELATEDAFRANPGRVWDWYAQRRAALAAVQPNAGHHALAAFGQRHPGRLTVITQNVDGLHQRAAAQAARPVAGGAGAAAGGPAPADSCAASPLHWAAPVLALHGNIALCRWLDTPCAACPPAPLAGVDAAGQGLAGLRPGHPPACVVCGNRLRPAVVWFGEMLPSTELAAAEAAAAGCDLMLVVGTAGVVYPAAGLAHHARSAGARVVIVNPEATDLDALASAVLRGTAARLLPQLLCVV